MNGPLEASSPGGLDERNDDGLIMGEESNDTDGGANDDADDCKLHVQEEQQEKVVREQAAAAAAVVASYESQGSAFVDDMDDIDDDVYRDDDDGDDHDRGSDDVLLLDKDDEENQAATITNDHDNNKLVLAKKETKAVKWLRVALILVLMGVGAGVSVAIYTYTHNDETQEFRDTFDNYATSIIDTVQVYAQNKLEAVGVIALQVQIHAVTQNLTWPFVTVPYFEERIMATQSLTDAYGVLLFPVVTQETRLGWEEYSVENRHWIWDSYAKQRQVYGTDQSRLTPEQLADPDSVDWWNHLWGPDYENPFNPDFSSGISSQIMTTQHEDPDVYDPIYDNSTGPYFPQWQTAPMGWYYQTTVNSNYGYFSDFLEQTKIVNETGYAVYGEAWSDDNTPGYISTLLYPIFDRFDEDSAASSVVAFLAVDIFWESFLKGILPPNSDGIYVVIENKCDQVFTFQLFGGNAEWVGDGDLHDTSYDDMERSTLFGEQLMEPITSPTYTGRPLDGSFCPYTFRVYPSSEMEDQYVTNRPKIYTAAACLLILFTSLVFVVYDWLVERRQRIVEASAQQSDALVSSMFPVSVKEKLYKHQESKDKDIHSDRRVSFKGIKKRFSGTERSTKPDASEEFTDINVDDQIIADTYSDTTILFADIAGFTKWSNGRDPHQVFHLLETIYFMFDKFAKRRGVFKISVIGDCYFAATGIPTPQEDHAIRMVKFARDCQNCLPNLLQELSNKLGEATRDLAVRVGLHSGPVTAGVLRGDKVRFELFGDTVNTASRMESNGQPNRIHVSEATAELLRKAGKGHWLTPREDKVFAKGKGLMQTYFVDVKRSESVKSHQSSRGSVIQAEAVLEEAIDKFERIGQRRRSVMMLGDSMRMISKSLQNLSEDNNNNNIRSSSSKSHSNFGYSPEEDVKAIISPIVSSSSSLSHHSQSQSRLARVDENSDTRSDSGGAAENLEPNGT